MGTVCMKVEAGKYDIPIQKRPENADEELTLVLWSIPQI